MHPSCFMSFSKTGPRLNILSRPGRPRQYEIPWLPNSPLENAPPPLLLISFLQKDTHNIHTAHRKWEAGHDGGHSPGATPVINLFIARVRELLWFSPKYHC